MKKWGKRSLGIAVIGVVLVAMFLLKFRAIEVETIPVKLGDVIATVVEKGTVTSEETTDIYSELSGKIQEIYIDTGDVVEQGKLLALMDVGELESQIARLQGELKVVKGMEQGAATQQNNEQIKQQQLELEQAQVALDLARDTYERTKKLYDEGAVNLVELEFTKADLLTKEKAVAQSEVALALLKKQSQGSGLQYQGQKESIVAQINYLKEQKKKGKIFTSLSGVVFDKNIKRDDFVTPGTVLFTIGNLNQLVIETYVSSKDLVYVGNGDKVTVVFRVAGKEIEEFGKIIKIDPVAESRMSALGILEDKIKVKVALEKDFKGINLVPGMKVDVTFITRKVENVLNVPKEVVFKEQGKEFVWLVKNGLAQVTQVETGEEGDDLIEIKKGIAREDHVILNPHAPELREGVKVKERVYQE